MPFLTSYYTPQGIMLLFTGDLSFNTLKVVVTLLPITKLFKCFSHQTRSQKHRDKITIARY